MNMISNFRSAPEIAALSTDEAKLLVREACGTKTVRRSSLIGFMLCGLCAGAGALIGDAFSFGIFGALIGGAVGGWVHAQVKMRAILKWIRARNAALISR